MCVFFFSEPPVKHSPVYRIYPVRENSYAAVRRRGWPRVKICHIPLRVGWSVMHSARPAILYYISRFVSFSLCYNLTHLCAFPSRVAAIPAGELCRTDRTTASWERLACDRQPIFHNYWYPVDSLQDYQKDTIASDNISLQKLMFLEHSRFAWDRIGFFIAMEITLSVIFVTESTIL